MSRIICGVWKYIERNMLRETFKSRCVCVCVLLQNYIMFFNKGREIMWHTFAVSSTVAAMLNYEKMTTPLRACFKLNNCVCVLMQLYKAHRRQIMFAFRFMVASVGEYQRIRKICFQENADSAARAKDECWNFICDYWLRVCDYIKQAMRFTYM